MSADGVRGAAEAEAGTGEAGAGRLRARDGLLLVLTLASGAVDAVCFLGLGHVFTAVVTGNLVLLGLGLGQADWAAVARSATAVGGYLIGVLAFARLLPRATRADPWPRRAAYAVIVEALLQLGVAVTWLLLGGDPPGGVVFPLIGAYGIAMGTQSAVAQAVAVRGISTTYVTGTLTGLITDLLVRRPGGRRHRALVILSVPLGALATALFLHLYRPAAPFLPFALTAAAVTTAMIVFRRHPRPSPTKPGTRPPPGTPA